MVIKHWSVLSDDLFCFYANLFHSISSPPASSSFFAHLFWCASGHISGWYLIISSWGCVYGNTTSPAYPSHRAKAEAHINLASVLSSFYHISFWFLSLVSFLECSDWLPNHKGMIDRVKERGGCPFASQAQLRISLGRSLPSGSVHSSGWPRNGMLFKG